MPTDTRPALSPQQVAVKCNLHINTVYNLIKAGKIPGVFRRGHKLRVDADAFEAFMANGGVR